MGRYRIYIIGRDDHFWSHEDIECTDDQEATQKAQQTMDGRDIELWERARFVARLSAKLSPQQGHLMCGWVRKESLLVPENPIRVIRATRQN